MSSLYNSQLVCASVKTPPPQLTYLSQDAFELHHLIQERPSSSPSPTSLALLSSLRHALSGSIGAALSNVTTYPLDLIITRLQIQRQLRRHRQDSDSNDVEYKGFRDAATKIYDREGLSGFYTGVTSDSIKTTLDSFLFFLSYSYLRERRLRKLSASSQLPPVEELSVGFVAGALTKLCTAPVANVVTRTQARAMTAPDSKTTARDIANEIIQEKGIPGFWSGYSASLILTLNPSLTFFLFEMLKRLTLPRSKRDNPPATMTFLLSALSKAMASAVTYPFSLAKSRLQAGGRKESDTETDEIEKDVSGKARQTLLKDTIFSTIFTIIEREGWTSLYEGLALELTKGFFSHGITMAIKQFLQRLITRFSSVLLLVWRRYSRNPKMEATKLREKAKENVEYGWGLAMMRVGEKIEQTASAASGVVEGVKDAANAGAEFVGEYVDESYEGVAIGGTVGLARWLGGDRGWGDKA